MSYRIVGGLWKVGVTALGVLLPTSLCVSFPERMEKFPFPTKKVFTPQQTSELAMKLLHDFPSGNVTVINKCVVEIDIDGQHTVIRKEFHTVPSSYIPPPKYQLTINDIHRQISLVESRTMWQRISEGPTEIFSNWKQAVYVTYANLK